MNDLSAAHIGSPTRARRVVRAVTIALLLAVGIAGGVLYWRGQGWQETDNAYVTGHIHPVSARVAGVVTRVLVADNQRVHAGDLVAELDDTDQRIRVEQMLAQIAAVHSQVKQAQAQWSQARSQAAAAAAQIAEAQAQAEHAGRMAQRYHRLFHSGVRVVARADVDAAAAARDAAAAVLTARREGAAAAHAQVDAAAAAQETLQRQIDVLTTQLKEARQQLGYHRIHAPATGYVGKRTLEVGARVQPGQSLLAVVADQMWITANFKETQLAGLQPGQAAAVVLDALPDRTFTGWVDSFAPASGAQFALLPPDNATGNFTRIVQRIPVKIVLAADVAAALAGAIKPGMSARVAVDVRSAPSAQTSVAASVLP